MDAWILFTLLAASAQTVRFMLQRMLKVSTLSTGGATFARFLFGWPWVVLGLIVWVGQGPLPALDPAFWLYATAGGVAQILATMCVVALFAQRTFAVGITFKKTEVLMAAGMGFVVLGEGVSLPLLGAILIGFVGVLLLSNPPERDGDLPWLRRLFNRGAGLGLASGALFAVSAVGYRGAALSWQTDDTILRALLTLVLVITLQVILMTVWLVMREPGQIRRVVAAWRIAGLTGLTSAIGSFGWFAAFSLQGVALVKAVGQVELVFSVLISAFLFRERQRGVELLGGALILVSVLALILGT